MPHTFSTGPGYLLVFVSTGDGVTEEEFHDWYDSEHIPLRTATLSEFTTATRFKALPPSKPIQTSSPESNLLASTKWAASYSISTNTLFSQEKYTKLRANRSQREGDLVKRLNCLDRRIYKQLPLFGSLVDKSTPTAATPGPGLVVFTEFTPKSGSETVVLEIENYVTSLKGVEGFLRGRVYEVEEVVVSGVGTNGKEGEVIPRVMVVTEFTSTSPLSNPSLSTITSEFHSSLKPLIVGEEIIERPFELWKHYDPEAARKVAEVLGA